MTAVPVPVAYTYRLDGGFDDPDYTALHTEGEDGHPVTVIAAADYGDEHAVTLPGHIDAPTAALAAAAFGAGYQTGRRSGADGVRLDIRRALGLRDDQPA